MSLEENDDNAEESELRFRLSILTNKHLIMINQRYQIIESNDPGKIREAILELGEERASEILADYAQAGAITCYMYVLDEDATSLVMNQPQKIVNELRATIQQISDAHPIIINSVRRTPEFNEIWIDVQSLSSRYSYHRFFDEHNKKKPIKLVKKRVIDDIVARFSADYGLLEVRTSDSILADKIRTLLVHIVGGTAERLRFSDEDARRFVDWAYKVRGANFRLLYSKISSLQMTAAKDEAGGGIHSLTEAEDFQLYSQKGKLVSVYIHMPPGKEVTPDGKAVHAPSKDEKLGSEEGYIGFRVNFLYGKIYFKTALSETEIRKTMKEVWTNVKIKRPTPSPEYKLYRYLDSTGGGESKADIPR